MRTNFSAGSKPVMQAYVDVLLSSARKESRKESHGRHPMFSPGRLAGWRDL